MKQPARKPIDAMNDKLNITIRVADVKPLGMTVTYEGEEIVRQAVHDVNRIWTKWMETRGPGRESKDVLAMVAFHFAKLYLQEKQRVASTEALLADFEKRLDDILLAPGTIV